MMIAIRRFKQFKGYISCVVANIRSGSTLAEKEILQNFQTADGKPRLFGRLYLPGAYGENIPRSLADPKENFPFILDKSNEATNNLSDQTVWSIKEILRSTLLEYGAVVLRGLAIKTATDFDRFSKALGLRSLPYFGGTAVRENVEGNIMTASREPPPYTIEPHNEMSYASRDWANYIWFFCETPPGSGCGGESVLVKNKDVLRDLDPEVTDKFRKLGVRYTNYLPSRTDDSYNSWQEALLTENKDVAEELLKDKRYSFEWYQDNSLKYWHNTDAFKPHHTTGEEVWFNQAQSDSTYFKAHPDWRQLENVPDDKMPFHPYYGDGSAIEPEVVNHLRAATWRNAIGLQLSKGDILFLDNMSVQHGRLGFVGERRLLVYLTQDTL